VTGDPRHVSDPRRWRAFLIWSRPCVATTMEA
jgi:hypothetical protein